MVFGLSEEITQEVFFRAIATEKEFRGESDECTWLCAIAKNLFYDAMRKQSRSGKITANLGRVNAANFESASGKIRLAASCVASLSAKAASGDIFCDFETVPTACGICTSSGKVTINLPENPNFTANINTTSGGFASDFALKKDGNNYVCGDGSADIDMETTSGDVAIWKR